MPPAPTTDAAATPASPSRRPAWRRAEGLGPVLGLVLLCIAGTVLNPDFATWDNAMNVLTRTAFIGIIAVGMCFVITSGGIDLSVGSMAALIAGSMIIVMNKLGPLGASPVWVVAAGVLFALYAFPFELFGVDHDPLEGYLRFFAQLAGGALHLVDQGVSVTGAAALAGGKGPKPPSG